MAVIFCTTCGEYLGCGDCDRCAAYRQQPADDEPQCGQIRPEDDACCVEPEGHEDDTGHVWVGGISNLCIADPMPGQPKPERKTS